MRTAYQANYKTPCDIRVYSTCAPNAVHSAFCNCHYRPELLIRVLMMLFASFASFRVCAQRENLPAGDFLAMVRQVPREESWVQLSGFAEHRRRGSASRRESLYMGIRFTPERTIAQLIAGGVESYRIGQEYRADTGGTTVIEERLDGAERPALLEEFGVRPEDLTLSFLYWPYLREDARESLRTLPCRVLWMKDPDDGRERVRVALSIEYMFPLRVEWFSSPETQKPERTLELDSFRKEDDFWVIDGLNLFGSGWRTRIVFEQVDIGLVKDGVPADLFREAGVSEDKSAD